MILKSLSNAPNQYSVIYADPPWDYKNSITRGAAKNHYPTMTLDEIKALPVKQLAADDSILFLWVTFPLLPEAFDVIEAWGFDYKTLGFCWAKVNPKTGAVACGLGNYTRSNPEICLLCTRGKPNRISKSVNSLVLSQREAHSKKPNIVRDRIKQLMGNEVPCIELFARQASEGWDSWGNELTPDDAA